MDADLLAFRRGYYDLFVSLLWREPSAELLARLGDGIAERAAGAAGLHAGLGAGWEAMGAFLAEVPGPGLADAVQDEYTRLLLGPGVPLVHLYESYYLTGKVLGRPLAEVRGYLAQVGLRKEPDYSEPEDFLAFELEVMRRLLARQAAATDAAEAARWLDAQATFLKDHLLVWGPAAARDLAGAAGARFYRGVGLILEAFLELERELAREWGPGEIPSLDAARRRLAGSGEWRGPLFEAPSG
jgi:TorA maturation chaperone TorD